MRRALSLALSALLLPSVLHAAQVSVRGADIIVDGKPFIPNGTSAETRLGELKALGANTIRTYGQEPGEILDAAQRAGLKVIVGLWLGHPRLGFDYANRAAVAQQLETLRHMVERYRTHPALLMWGIGNEVEVDLTPEDAMAVWPAIEEAAKLAKTLDGQHPTLVALAEVGQDKAALIRRHAPSIDVIGINGYGDGLLTAVKRARAQGWTGPLILTEMGAQGHWDAPGTPWGAKLEPTSTAKADRVRRYLLTAKQAGVGAMPFLWGQKQEVTPTWYSLLLPTGEWTETVEAMAESWGGTPPGGANRAPRILALTFAGPVRFTADSGTQVRLTATDPDGDPLRMDWAIMAETTVRSVGGDPEPVPPSFPAGIHDPSPVGVRIAGLPPGRYRVFVTVRDGRGAAATGNLPFEVQ
ncbi:glycosyl hydrolase [Xanthobacter autotrophicus]|uniref:glycosyl hydrolase n=1 Tax=Xanthobacter TaxID=279 RepID=UPI0024AA6210|nr:glycosyl hydrolase [Xanthobacter autotrophicus]MDI4665444.1 glycosyl hydrolase [Xanthobacter autotrophicus]